MKILSGYEIRPTEEFDVVVDPSGKYVPPKNFDFSDVCHNNQCELFVGHILDYIHSSQIEYTISTVISKIRKGGKVYLSGTNLDELNRLYMMGHYDTQEYNALLYSNTFKCGMYTPSFIINLLSKGLKIDEVKLDGHTFTIGAIRE